MFCGQRGLQSKVQSSLFRATRLRYTGCRTCLFAFECFTGFISHSNNEAEERLKSYRSRLQASHTHQRPRCVHYTFQALHSLGRALAPLRNLASNSFTVRRTLRPDLKKRVTLRTESTERIGAAFEQIRLMNDMPRIKIALVISVGWYHLPQSCRQGTRQRSCSPWS